MTKHYHHPATLSAVPPCSLLCFGARQRGVCAICSHLFKYNTHPHTYCKHIRVLPVCIGISTLIREAATTTTTTATITRTTTTYSPKEHRNCNRNRNRLAAICCLTTRGLSTCFYIWNLIYIYHVHLQGFRGL